MNAPLIFLLGVVLFIILLTIGYGLYRIISRNTSGSSGQTGPTGSTGSGQTGQTGQTGSTGSGQTGQTGPTGSVQTATVRVRNSCQYDLWIEARAGDDGAAIPVYKNGVSQAVTPNLLSSSGYLDYDIPSNGLAATKFWAKYGCDENGTNCIIGDQDQYWRSQYMPGGGCPTTGPQNECSPNWNGTCPTGAPAIQCQAAIDTQLRGNIVAE
jgi:hypothetical protein